LKDKLIKFTPAIAAVFSFIVYLFTMSRGVMPIDAGELAASQYTLGISHPSGYPLFNILGFLWSKIPVGNVILRLNILCALYVALANFFLIKTSYVLLIYSPVQKLMKAPATTTKKQQPAATTVIQTFPLLALICSISGVLIIGFSKTWWIQSAGVEVYSLHIALLSALFYFFFKSYFKEKTTAKDWIIPGICIGLSLSNHITSGLVLPAVVALYFIKMKFTKSSLINMSLLAGSAFGILIIMYGFMMARAGSSPLVNYGNPSTMEYFMRHVNGWQFRSFMDTKKSNETVITFFKNLSSQTLVFGLILFITGVVFTLMKNIKMTVFWGLNLIAILIYASRFDIHDIENYFLIAYASVAIFIAFGMYTIVSLIKNVEGNKAIYALLLLPIAGIGFNYSDSDQSKLHYIDDYAQAALASVEPNAIILSREWDVLVSPVYYYHLVEKQREDVVMLDKELLRRSWYFNQIKQWDKELSSKIQDKAVAFNDAVLPFERQVKFDPANIQIKFEMYITSILEEYKTRPVYISPLILEADIVQQIDVKLPKGTILVPDAYFYRVIPESDTAVYYPTARPVEFNVRITENWKDDKFQKQIVSATKNILSARVGYELSYGKREEAKRIVAILQEIDPTIKMPENL